MELYFCFFDAELHVNSDHDGDSPEDEDHNDQFNAKSIRTQRALRFPNGKFLDGLYIFGTARKENFFKAIFKR